LRLLAEADTTPGLYLAYNKSTQLAAQQHAPAHVACRTMHSLAYRARRMFAQQHRLKRKLTGRKVAEMLAILTLDGLRPSFSRDLASSTGIGSLPSPPGSLSSASAIASVSSRLGPPQRGHHPRP
jgi:hypothetical protein